MTTSSNERCPICGCALCHDGCRCPNCHPLTEVVVESYEDRIKANAHRPVVDMCPDDEHDDRRDPFFVYPAVPPLERIVCARCKRSYMRPITASPYPGGEATWPKA